jgi:hypothetical protein
MPPKVRNYSLPGFEFNHLGSNIDLANSYKIIPNPALGLLAMYENGSNPAVVRDFEVFKGVRRYFDKKSVPSEEVLLQGRALFDNVKGTQFDYSLNIDAVDGVSLKQNLRRLSMLYFSLIPFFVNQQNLALLESIMNESDYLPLESRITEVGCQLWNDQFNTDTLDSEDFIELNGSIYPKYVLNYYLASGLIVTSSLVDYCAPKRHNSGFPERKQVLTVSHYSNCIKPLIKGANMTNLVSNNDVLAPMLWLESGIR